MKSKHLSGFIAALFVLLTVSGRSQTCPAVTALAGSATTTNICQGSCVTLNTTLTPVNATTNYSFQSIPYTGFPYVGGTTVIPTLDDVWSGVVNIGFPFCYFGNTFNQLLVGSNGQITFSTSLANQPEFWQINNIMPNLVNTPGNTINGVFRDINPALGGTVRVYTTGIAPCRKFVAYWLNVPLFGCPTVTASTFQIVLHETTNIIDINIINSSGACTNNNGRGLVGVQNNNATLGVAPPTRNNLTNWTALNETWRFTPTGAPTYTINWFGPSFTATGPSATVCPTASGNYTAVMTTARCGGGPNIIQTSTAQINVTPNPTVSAFNLSGTICAGNSASLVASGALNYTWTPGNLTGNIVNVTPTATTVYTVLGAVGTCTGTATVTVPVSNGPTVTIASTPTSICSGSGGSATLTANGAVSYTWNPGSVVSNSIVITPTATISYSAVGSNSLGCTSTTSITYSVLPTPTVNASASSTNVCSGNSATLTATGATTYTWNPGNLTGSSIVITPTANTIYTVSGQNGNCIGTRTIAINVSPSPTVTASGSPTLLCSGNSSTLTANGATTYTWNPGNLTGSSVVVTPSATTNYTVRGTSGSCTAQAVVSISVNPTPTLNPIASPTAICLGNTATLSSTGATTYTWNPGNLTGSSVTVSPVANTVYTVTGTTNSCTSTRTLALTVNPNPTVTASASPTVICAGAQTTLTAGGATTYTWNPGNLTGSSVVVTPSVNTTYTVRGANGTCTSSAVVSISVNPSPTVTASSSPTSICAGVGATATLTGTGATSYTWNPGNLSGTSVTVSPASTTVYTLTGSNASGCTSTALTTVSVVPVPTINATASASTICAGNSTTLSATGATGYTWNPGSLSGSSVVVTPTANTIYTVTGSNGSCTSTAVVSITVNPSPTVTASGSPTLLCSGNSSTLTANGATTYTWNPGNLTGSSVVVTPSATTNYTVRGTSGSCTAQAVVSISVNPTPTLNPIASPTAICLGNTATLSSTGATTYTWNPGNLTGSSVTVSPVANTVYTVTGTTNSCTSTRTLALTVNPNPTVTASASPTVICAGAQTTLTAGGATTYTWNPGNLTGSSVVVTPSVNTTYTVRGANGTCTSSAVVSISVNPSPTVTASSSPTSICAGVGATATLTGTGATSYTWNPGNLSGTSVTVSPVSTTVYTLTGSNASGCTSTALTTVSVVPVPTINTTASASTICAGNSTTLSAIGATGYTWNPGSLSGSSVVVTPTANTIYTVTGSNGSCTSTAVVSITVNPSPTVAASSNPTIICSGNTATLTASGATTYTWNPGNLSGSTVTVSPNNSTTYTVIGTAGSCTSQAQITLFVNPTPTVVPVANPTAICAGNTSTLSATGAGSFTWNPGNLTGSSVTVSPSSTTIYTVSGSIANCVSSSIVTLTVNPNPTVTASASPSVICAGAQTTLTASGATSYTWNPGNLTGANVVVTPSVNTTYTVIGSNGLCTSSAAVSVSVSPQPTIVASGTPTNICSSPGGSATLTATGAVSYIWNPGSLFGGTVVVTQTATTSYTVVGSSAAGCLSSTVVTIQITPTPTLNINATSASICAGNTTTLTSTGASSYTWNPGSLTGSLVAVSPTASTVYTVTGINGICSSTGTIAITVNPNPTVTASANSSVICSGSSSTLSASGATSYTWNPGSLTGSSVAVTPSVTTVYTVTGSNGLCSSNSTVQVIVNPTPTLVATAIPTAICAGGSSTLFVSGASTYTYLPVNLSFSFSTLVVTPSVSTVYTVIGSSSLGCNASTTVNVIVNPNPTVTIAASPTNVCSGSQATLSASGATSYTWNPGTLVSNSIVVNPTVTTSYTVTGLTGFCTNTAVQTISVLPTPTIVAAIPGPTTICSGGGTSIFVTGVVTATWQPGNLTGITVAVTPTATTVYTVTGSNLFGCTASTTVQVNVIPTPTVNVTATSTNVCAGSGVTLTATGASSYAWQPGSLTGSVVAVNPSGTTVYTVTGSNSFCSSSNTILIQVTPNPTVSAVSSPTAICRNSSATLTASGATSYTWLPSLSNATSIVVSPTVTTSYTVIGANGTCSNTAVVSVSVLPTPNINTFANPINVCSGNSSTLIAFGAQSYTWNPGSVAGQTIVVTPSVTTVYTVTGTNAFGCSNTATRVVNVIPLPTVNVSANPATLCLGGSSTLTASGANFYLWTPGPLTGSQVVVSPTVTTTYTVTGNVGPCSNTQTITVNVVPTPTLTVSASNTLVCAAASVTLNVAGAGSYTWNPGAFTNSVYVVNPLVSTVYTVTGSNSGSCTVTETIAVNVSPGPTITVAATNTSICTGNSVVITPTGATTYTLLPGAQSGSSFTVSPSSTITYTILGSDPVGCPGVATLQIIVNPIPSITITPSSNGICTGNTVTLTATGTDTYTWLPSASTGSVFTDNPSVTTVYTVVGTSTAGCSSTATISIGVTPVPTVTAFSSSTVVCQSGSVTLSAIGATNYTWNPGALNGGTVVVNPTVTTTYTVEGDNGGCSSTATVEVIVTPGPQDVTASSSGSLTCVVFTVGLNGSTTSTNVAYFWNGPSSFTSNVQNPSPVSVGGTYTLTVTDLNTGCSISATTAVISNTAVPDFTVTSSGDLGCNAIVTLSASSSASAGITYTWSGPATFTSASQSFTTNVVGVYTVSAFDISSGCVSSLTVAVNSNTDLPVFTATILPATCNGTVSNNDGTILVSGNGVRFDLVTGSSYTGTATYTTATPIPTTGIITNTLVNPSVITPYTIRIYGSNGCFKDTTLNLIPINCDNRVFGLTKAAGTPSLVNNLYQISYTVTAINADISNNLTNVTLNENLNSTFPLPTTYTVVGTPVITSQGSSLTINPLFNGSTEISLTTPSLSIIPPAKRDTIVFTVLIDPKGYFGPFVNSVIGFANDVNSLTVSDSSNDGFIWDPDADGNPTNNNIPTVVNLIPNSRIGIAKAAVVSPVLPDNTYDVTYIVTVKNFGNDTLKAVQVRDSLFAKTVPLPAQYTIKTAPSITGTLLTANANFNGNTDINLLSGTDNLAPGASDTIRFTINIKTDTVTVFRNSATAFAGNQFSTGIVRDTSQTGYNPDPNNDGNPNEMDPTVIVLPSSELIIPEVFTPNGDGKNDFYVIKGLNGRKVKMIVFNRWGNKVYENPEYDNTWDGYPNVKTMVIGNDKLPQGTYFFILEFQDKEKEVKTGYVVIQY